MAYSSDKILEQHLKSILEEQLGWGASEHWATKDFEKLSVLISEKTSVQLSVTTLKRFLGTIKSETNFSTSTLDAIAQFLEYPSWRVFVEKHSKPDEQLPSTKELSQYFTKLPKLYLGRGLLGLILLLGLATIFSFWVQSGKLPFSSAIPFEIKKVSRGLPNTVIFKYDLSNVQAQRIQIQQYWDDTKRIDIQTDTKEAAAIYYYPGYYEAKLVLDGQAVEERDLYIPSDGWFAAIESGTMPRYILEEELETDGALHLKEAVVQEILAKNTFNWLSFSYLEEFEALQDADFELETAFKNTLKTGNNICQKSRIRMIGTEGVISVHFSIPGCVAKNRIYLNGRSLEGHSNDLSSLGLDYTAFNAVRIVKKGMQVQIFKEDKLLFNEQLAEDIGKIAGVTLSFEGAGAIDYVRLKSGGKDLIKEEFQLLQ